MITQKCTIIVQKGSEIMEEELFYYNLKKKEKEAVLGFIVSALLKSRRHAGLESNKGFFDEDVNVYLAHLLLAYTDPGYCHSCQRYISLNDLDVFKMIEDVEDSCLRYFVYKVNADNLLLSLGIFQNLKDIKDKSIGRAKTYYELAASYNKEIYRKITAVSEVLGKLSTWFERYLAILTETRREYFNILEYVSDPEISSLIHELEEYEKECLLHKKYDEFLDAYSAWLRDKKEETRHNLERIAKELKEIDTGFHFHLTPA